MKKHLAVLLCFILMLSVIPAWNPGAATKRPSYLFAIDAGHGGKDPGSIGADKRYESNDNKKIADEVISLLKNQGQSTYLINRNLVTQDRPIEANKKNADFLISLHRDSSTSSSPRGINVYTHEPKHIQRKEQPKKDYAPAEHSDKHEVDEKLVNNLKSYLTGATAIPFKGVHYGSASAPTWEDYFINRLSNMPSCIIELGFVSNSADNKEFDKNYKKLAVAIVKALLATVGLDYIESGKTGSCTYTLTGKKLDVTGSGAMANYTSSAAAPWGTAVTEVEIASGVTAIGNYSFNKCAALTKISIPETVTKIGSYAFNGCGKLSEIRYYGTSAEWNEISKGGNNSSLSAARILYICDMKGHKYDYPCSSACSVCGEAREPDEAHTYSSDCDISCNICGEIREAEAEHTYSADCDRFCDLCKYRRTTDTPHNFDENDICTACGSPKVMTGDLNEDERVTDADAIQLLMYTFFPEDYPVNQDCDFNNDGKTTDADAVYLLMYTFFPEDYPI